MAESSNVDALIAQRERTNVSRAAMTRVHDRIVTTLEREKVFEAHARPHRMQRWMVVPLFVCMAGAAIAGGAVVYPKLVSNRASTTATAPSPKKVERAPESAVELEVPAPRPTPIPEVSTPDVDPNVSLRPRVRSAPSRDVLLAQERGLIERARTSLLRRNLDDCERALGEHEARFAAGQLVEEREAIAIQLLVVRGELATARDRALRFGLAFPDSMLQPAIDAALRSGE